ncbi:hypothetical protein BP6252_07534 [Coleophoma cylindrospora]|uniref:Ubiquitin-like domain-containing protein n=1 Tax=Coleophoma cylindrospora TaxID=1849047 RepID=A0A3D8RAR0_9HELO|nr:hypothetical protein BP6252_07534 [Coleophoma cylindrospora]
MSFGYSFGDFVAGANISYRLLRILADSKGASIEYQEVIAELGTIQQTFMQVGYMTQNKNFSQATTNAASHIILSAIELIGKFLAKTQRYRESLCGGGNGNAVSNSWQKVGWVMFKSEELSELRDALHRKVCHVGVLLSTAQFHARIPDHIAQYEIKTPELVAKAKKDAAEKAKADREAEIAAAEAAQEAAVAIKKEIDDAVKKERDRMIRQAAAEKKAAEAKAEADAEQAVAEWKAADEKAAADKKAIEDAVAKAKAEMESTIVAGGGDANKKKTIKFKDAVGRKFSFPFHLCQTWAGMEELIRQAFLHVDILGPHVADGRYDLIGPNGEIILPQVWDKMIEPDWAITMLMWPMPDLPKLPLGLRPEAQPRPLEERLPPSNKKKSPRSLLRWRDKPFTFYKKISNLSKLPSEPVDAMEDANSWGDSDTLTDDEEDLTVEVRSQ